MTHHYRKGNDMPARISTKQARSYVQRRLGFRTHGSLYGTLVTATDGTVTYVVYSYGDHWPLFVEHDGVWYENSGRYSMTTSNHHSAAHPHCPTQLATCDALKRFIRRGVDCHPSVAPLISVSV